MERQFEGKDEAEADEADQVRWQKGWTTLNRFMRAEPH